MEKILNQSHSNTGLLYASSRMFERASYYGVRAVIVLYMISGSLNITDAEAIKLYGWFTAGILLSGIFGAFLVDIFLGNKRTLIAGGVIQAFGVFSLCIPSVMGLYSGLALIILGNGLYSPNLIANYGKHYLEKPKILDAGYTLLYIAINVGAFLGPLTIGLLGEENWTLGFITAGCLMLISVSFPFLIRKAEVKYSYSGFSMGHSLVIIIFTVVMAGIFWAMYEVYQIGLFHLHNKFQSHLEFDLPKPIWSSIGPAMIFPVAIIALVVWTYFYSSSFRKLAVGFILAAISYGLLILIPEVPANQHLIIYLFSMLLLGIAEINVAPITYSLLTKYSNPQYLAIVISLAFLPTKGFTSVVNLFYEYFNNNPTIAFTLAAIGMGLAGTGIALLYSVAKRIKPETPLDVPSEDNEV